MLKKLFGILILLIIGCKKQNDNSNLNNSTNLLLNTISEEEKIDSINFLALGDSYTIGEGLEVLKSWPNQLSDSLVSNHNFKISLNIVAETGFRTADLKTVFSQLQFDKNYNLISLLIGVNDQFLGSSKEEFRIQLDELVNLILSEPAINSSKLFVVSIPDWGYTPFGSNYDRTKISNEIDDYNNILKGVCEINQIHFINITDISRTNPNDWSLVTFDGLHPSEKMYNLWLEKILPKTIQILN